MELGVRDWMIIVGVLLIVAVLIDGYRRVRIERRGKIRMSLNKQFLNSASDEEHNSCELPKGRARTVGRANGDDNSEETSHSDFSDHFSPEDLDLEQDVPMLMESVSAQSQDHYQAPVVDPSWADDTRLDGSRSDDPRLDGKRLSEQTLDEEPPVAVEINQHHEQPRVDSASAHAQRSKLEKSQVTDIKDKEMVVINVVAKDEHFKGPDLLHILLACDVRFGEMNIFHRHEKANGSGAVQFSVANSVEPGDFNLENIDEFTTPGVCFFMSVPGPEKAIEAFDCLVETAQCLVKNLNGELRDESRSVMTAQTLEHCRARLFEFERRQLTHHA
jgi:cell division protein ZipA